MGRKRVRSTTRTNDLATVIAVAETISRRVPILVKETIRPTPNGQAEIALMVHEKQRAMVGGMMAAQAQLLTETLRFWSNPFKRFDGARATQRIARASLAPGTRTVKANAKRLRKRDK